MMGLFDSMKTAVFGSNVADEPFYEVVAHELAQNAMRPGLWAKALAETEYVESKAKARYIQLCVESLKVEATEHARRKRAVLEAQARENEIVVSDALPAYQRGDYCRALQGFLLRIT